MEVKKHLLSYLIAALTVTAFVFTIPFSVSAAKSKPKLKRKQLRQTTISSSSRKRVQIISKDPYLGAIVVDAATGEALFEDNPDIKGYPASLVKMMNLLIVLEASEAKKISLDDVVTVSAAVSRIGGSQVFLKENETFKVDDLLYALMVHSANDAALALALHTAGTKDAFVKLMNDRAKKIGMNSTTFHSVHGLPPGKGQFPDSSTPRDITKLALELLKHPEALKYTSTKVRPFRTDAPEPFIMRNRNSLVKDFEGCDGLKTGFFYAAGFSIAATAVNEKGRAIAVIFGSSYSKVRNEKARELLTTGLIEIAAKPPPPPAPVVTASISLWERPYIFGNKYIFVLGLVCGVFVIRKFST